MRRIKVRKIKIDPSTPEHFRKILIDFIVKYGDGHITKRAINWLKNTPFSKINQANGDIIHVQLGEKNNIIGILAVAKYGLEQSITVVHPKARNKGIAYQLTAGVLEDINRMYVKVAYDNIPSLKLCFATGMRAFAMTKGATGKPTLILGLGDWSQREWESAKS